MHRDWTRRAWIAGFLLGFNILIFVLTRVTGCSSGGKSHNPPPPAPGACDFGLKEGQKRVEACDGGRRTLLCTKDGLEEQTSTCREGEAGPDASTFHLSDIELTVLADAQTLNQTERNETRWIVATHKRNEGSSEAEIAVWKNAMNKALNGLSTAQTSVSKAKLINREMSIWRIYLDDYDIEAADWDKVGNAVRLKTISETDTGKLIRGLTKTDFPWLTVDDLVDTTQANADIYYDLVGFGQNLNDVLTAFNIDFAEDVGKFETAFAGSNKSPISIQKNRLITRTEGGDGRGSFFWQTFDPIAPGGVAARNLFAFPFIKEVVGTQKIFEHAASEIIFSNRAGMQLYGLFNAQGVRQNAAPLNVVADNIGPKAEIRNAISCSRCHAAGIIPMQDQVRDSVISAAGGFVAADVERVKALYRPQAELDSLFKADQDKFQAALTALDISPTDADPINEVEDAFVLDWDLRRVASRLFLTPEEFTVLLEQSALAKAQLGTLLNGDKVTSDQFIDAFQQVVLDLGLFRESIENQ